MKRPTATLRVLVLASFALSLSGASGCSPNILSSATKYASAEQAASAALVPLANLPYRLCLRTAQYTYLWDLVKPGPTTPVDPWLDWYRKTGAAEDMAAAGRMVTWERDCQDAEDAGQQIRRVLRALRSHAVALGSLATSKSFDTSGLKAIASGGASISTTAGAPASVSATVTDAGSAVASFTSKFVEWYQQGKLDEAVEASDDCMKRVGADLRTMVDAVSGELDVLRRQRRAVAGMLSKRAPAAADGHVVGDTFELAQDVEREFKRVEDSLPRYGAAIQRLSDAHHLLAQQARSQVAEKDVDTALATLNAAIEDLLDEEWSR
jgi:hypothetical protein